MGQLIITKNSESERATMEVLDLMTVERRRMGEDDPEARSQPPTTQTKTKTIRCQPHPKKKKEEKKNQNASMLSYLCTQSHFCE